MILTVNESWRASPPPCPSRRRCRRRRQLPRRLRPRPRSLFRGSAHRRRRLAPGAAGRREGIRLEYPCHSPTDRRWFHLTVTALRDDRRSGAVVMHVNVTERKLTENALRESNEKFHLLADNITDAFWIRSPDMSEVRYISPAFARIWGRPPETAVAESAAMGRLHRARRPRARARRLRRAHGRHTEPRHRVSRRAARWRDPLDSWSRGFQVRNAAGELTSLTGIVTDITERKQVEETLRESEERFSSAFEQAPIGVALVGLDGRWLKVNRPSAIWWATPQRNCSPAPSRTSRIADDLESDLENVRRMHRRRHSLLPDGEALRSRPRTPRHGVVECVAGAGSAGSAALLHLPDSGHHQQQEGGAGVAGERGGNHAHQPGPPDRDRGEDTRGGCGRPRQPCEERVPGQHEPRDSHAVERRRRHDRTAAPDRPRGRAARVRGPRQGLGRVAADPHRRHPRLLEDRGRASSPSTSSRST